MNPMKHWSLHISETVANLVLDVKEDAIYRPGYQLKLNSYDLGVDLELADVVERLRLELIGQTKGVRWQRERFDVASWSTGKHKRKRMHAHGEFCLQAARHARILNSHPSSR